MQNYLVTGTSSGLGKEIKDLLLSLGKNVFFDELIELSSMDDIEILAEKFKGIDCLVNCAGVNYLSWFPKADWDMYEHLMAVNLRAPLYLTQCLIDKGSFATSPTILNITSLAADVPMTNTTFYNSAKAALKMATRQLARELKKTHDITVFAVSPNKIKGTKMSNYVDATVPLLRGWTPEEAAEYQKRTMLSGEEIDPVEIAKFICYLICEKDHHKYLNGCIMPYGVS
jgi:NAD(P)-dependent dehydrogenase (short-subunit alcohol dehydrogenase family)